MRKIWHKTNKKIPTVRLRLTFCINFDTGQTKKKNPTCEVEINFFVKFNTTPRWIQKFPTVTHKEQECSAARQAMAATAQQWCFAEVLSCSSSHGGCSLVVFSHYNWRPLHQSVKTLPALSCQVCKLASHIGHGVVAALSDVDCSCQHCCSLSVTVKFYEKVNLYLRSQIFFVCPV